MIKIAFIIDTIESPTAGTEKQLITLIRHLDRDRFHPYLCVLRSSEWLCNYYRDCEVVEINVRSFYNLSSYRNIIEFGNFLKRNKVDIVQTHFPDGNKVGVVAGLLAGVKAIISTRRNQGYWHSGSELLVLRLINRWVTRFLANSQNTRNWAAKAEGIAPDRIEVIHNALEVDKFFRSSQAERCLFREKLGFPATAVVTGVVANLRPVKAIDVFVQAAKVVSKACPDAPFVVVGEGDQRDHLESLAARLGLADVLVFLGQRLDVPEILGCIDIGVLSSMSESFSNAILEYMAAELAVVCTDVGGATEAVENGVTGYVVGTDDSYSMANRLISLIESGSFRRMGTLGRKKAGRLFSIETIVKRHQQLYSELL